MFPFLLCGGGGWFVFCDLEVSGEMLLSLSLFVCVGMWGILAVYMLQVKSNLRSIRFQPRSI